ncbi:outer membrane protein assembly factor BamA [Engelhardtia mirabilis]|uniref:Outer membrane protein assembly factor BamA n=1 Tax=Engelhardtia mirabilis TaxID=2528011 RepID=A0A518BKY9_9BACT|nr:Outer membrane protein assembly factor BamA precursor [Planctomycetes bacterium Pla133]QDV01963.1 Outer membrane protein assembly factor BamA precursor [Planctomycetes bacterium Pla86]
MSRPTIHLLGAALLALLLAGCVATAVDDQVPLARPVEFVGDPDADRTALAELVSPWIADYVATEGADAYLDDAAYELRTRYLDNGHPFAQVSYEVAGPDAPIRFTLEPGPIVVLGELTILGADWLGLDYSSNFFLFPKRSIGGSNLAVFTDRALRDGMDALDAAYFEAGFLDVQIQETRVDVDRDAERAEVVVQVREGLRYKVGRLELQGETALDPEDLEELLGPFRARSYNPRLPYDLRNDLLELYGNRGRPDATIEFQRTVDRESGVVDLVLQVQAGPEVHISEVRLVGNTDTRDSFILDRMELEVGDRYSRSDARKSFERIYRTGLFDRVAVQLVKEEGEQRALVVEVEERPSQEVFLEPGYGAYELFRIKTGYREQNLFGTGRQLRIEGALAVRVRGAEIGITDPDFFNRDLTADLSLTYDERAFPSFTRAETSTEFSLRWPWSTHLEGQVSYQFRATTIFDVDVVDVELPDAGDNVDISSISFTPLYDSRDRLFVPQAGQASSLKVEWASPILGSELEFTRTTLKAARYISFDEEGNTVLAMGAEVGAIFPSGDTDSIPLQERYFTGGAKSVRAFKQYELGPVDDNGEQIGGEAYSLGTIELRQNLGPSRLQGALFSDYGNVLLNAEELLELKDYEGGFGFGLRYVLPVGPIRLDVAFNPAPKSGQDDYVIHLAVGMPF